MEQEYINYLKNENKSLGTIQTYILDLKCYMKWLKETTGKELKKLYRENIQDYICYLRNNKKTKKGLHLKAQSINVHISSLIKFNEFLIKTGRQQDVVITENDTIAVQRMGINPCKVTQQEIREFRQDILEDESRSLNNFETIRNFCMVTILQYCGLRISECISIEIAELSLETRELRIIRKRRQAKDSLPKRPMYFSNQSIFESATRKCRKILFCY